MQQTTSGAAGNGLYTTIKYLCGAAGIGLGTTPRFCAAGVSQLLKSASTTPRIYGRRQRPVHYDQVHAWRRGHRPGHHDQVPAAHNERRREQRPGTTIKYLVN
jgi:hypothetical protein